MMDRATQEQNLKRLQRLRLLQKVSANAPYPIAEQVLLTGLMKDDADLEFTKSVIRQHLDYLHERGLMRVEQSDDIWAAKILPYGTDYLDGLGKDIAGIARPTDM